MYALLNAIFGCAHKKTTFPITPTRQPGKSRGTYVVCLNCGTEFEYDWHKMRICKAVNAVVPVRIGEESLETCAAEK